jgi:hypothetical protein
MAIGRLASNRWGASSSAASVTARISSEPIPLKRAAPRRPAAFPRNAHRRGLLSNSLGTLRSDDILITACDHIESDLEAANALRRAT